MKKIKKIIEEERKITEELYQILKEDEKLEELGIK